MEARSQAPSDAIPGAPASMTGFAACEGEGPSGRLRVEVRSLNHRHLDVATRLPRSWPALEARIRDLVAAHLARGRVEIAVTAQDLDPMQRTVRVNGAILRQYWEQLSALAQELGIATPLSLSHLLILPGAVESEERDVDEAAIWAAVEPLLQAALQQVLIMRRREGARLWKDVDARLQTVLDAADELERAIPSYMTSYGHRLESRVRDLLHATGAAATGGPADETMLDEQLRQRLAQELAVVAERADIAEELQRLRSHVWQMRRLAGEVAPGRRMEFLLREMDRELATATVKAPDPVVVHRLVEVRGLVEQVREQVLNFE